MPKVGKKHFSYTKRGKKAAQAYAKRVGVTVVKKPNRSKKRG